MQNSVEKLRTIGRSVLPATRNGARTARHMAAATKRKNRRGVKQELHLIGDEDDYIEEGPFLDVYPDEEIRSIVSRRRDFDNLGAAMRWAKSKIDNEFAHMSDEECYYALKALLPDTLQGRHVLGHIKDALLDLDPTWRRFTAMTDSERKKLRIKQKEEDLQRMRDYIATAVELVGHKRLNQLLRRSGSFKYDHVDTGKVRSYGMGPSAYTMRIRTTCEDCGRLYLGEHDLEAFAQFLSRIRYNSVHHNSRDVIEQIVEGELK